MSYSSFKKDKLLMESWRNYVNEEASASEMDPNDFPMKLSQVGDKYTRKQAKAIATGGLKDGDAEDDKIGMSKGSWGLKQLKPSQSSMNINKALNFSIMMLLKKGNFSKGPGGDLGCIVTSDNHIMDGHHRWVASGMIKPDVTVGGYEAAFPAKEMIAVLNILTLHFTGRRTGKKASGGFEQFSPERIKSELVNFTQGKGLFKGSTPEEVLRACEIFTEQKGEAAITAAATKFAENAGQLTLSLPQGFPARPDMPIISKGKGHLDLAVKLLSSGAVDINPKFAGKTGEPGGIPSGITSDAVKADRERKMRDLEEGKTPKKE